MLIVPLKRSDVSGPYPIDEMPSRGKNKAPPDSPSISTTTKDRVPSSVPSVFLFATFLVVVVVCHGLWVNGGEKHVRIRSPRGNSTDMP